MSRPIVRLLSPEIQGDGSYFAFYGANCICTLITLSVLRFYPCTFLFSNVTPALFGKFEFYSLTLCLLKRAFFHTFTILFITFLSLFPLASY